MKFKKLGLVYQPPFDNSWRDNSGLTPTPFLVDNDTIRIFAGFRDPSGVSRIGYVDVESDDPTIVKKISERPVLDIGRPGMFDDNGMILGDIFSYQGKVYMAYVGFQLVQNVKFLAFSGLAEQDEQGEFFNRTIETPFLDRSTDAIYIRAIHSVLVENDEIRIWYATGNGWQKIDNKYYPQYDISTQVSNNLNGFLSKGTKCITNDPANGEYRIGRPRVYIWKDKYVMFYTYGTIDGRYMAGMANSDDGIHWHRNDENLGIELSEKGWDSVHLSYPALITVKGRTFMFYNGNNMGYEGFGCAELIDDSLT